MHIPAWLCAADFFDYRGDHNTAEFVRNTRAGVAGVGLPAREGQQTADFLESHIERWTVTTEGTLVQGISRHYMHINPASSVDCADEDPNCGTLRLANQPPGARYELPAKEIVDAGFLELVRYGIHPSK